MKSILTIVVLFSVGGVTALAQQPTTPNLGDLSIEDLMNVRVETVYGASKFLQNVSDAPASVSIITADDIQRNGYITLAEALASVRSLYVIYDRNYSYLGVRGFVRQSDFNARVLVLIDGHRYNDNIFDGGDIGTMFPVDLSLIDHIEVIRGPGSAVYGPGAVVAVINIVTKRGRDLSGWQLSGSAASWESYQTRLSFGRRFSNRMEMLLSATFYNSVGHDRLFFPEFNSPATNNGMAVNADGDQYYNFLGELIRGDFTIHAVMNSRTKHIPTASYGTVFNDASTKTTDARRYVDVQYAHSFQSKWDVLARASYDWYRYNGVYVNDPAGLGIPPFVNNIDRASGDWSNFEFDASHVFFRRHHLTMGAELRDDYRQHQANYNQQPYALFLDNTVGRTDAAYYVQDDFRLGKRLILVGAVRSDRYDQFGTTYSPRGGIIFTPRDGTRIKLMYNKAFRAPNRFEQFYVSNNTNEANPLLQPERIISYEVEIDQNLTKDLRLVLDGYVNDIDELIDADLNPVTGHVEYLNADYQDTRGFEVELRGKWGKGIEGNASYSFQNSNNPNVEGIVNSPHNLGKSQLSFPVYRQKFIASFEGQYNSRTSTLAGTVLGGYGVVNATILARRLTRNVDVSLTGMNLFDKRYAVSGSLEHQEVAIEQDGRSVRAKLTYRFSSR